MSTNESRMKGAEQARRKFESVFSTTKVAPKEFTIDSSSVVENKIENRDVAFYLNQNPIGCVHCENGTLFVSNANSDIGSSLIVCDTCGRTLRYSEELVLIQKIMQQKIKEAFSSEVASVYDFAKIRRRCEDAMRKTGDNEVILAVAKVLKVKLD